ncbi:MAG: hypothetical protein AAGK97_12820, partial [Bacteroidota bacterium]
CLIGHSSAGGFVANTFFSDKIDLFNAYIAISPSMHYPKNQILKDAQLMIQKQTRFHKFFYCSYGTVGSHEEYFKPDVDFLDSLFTAHPNNTVEWKKEVFNGKTHFGIVAPSITDGIIQMNRAYEVDHLLIEKFALNEGLSMREQIKNHLRQQQAKLQYTFEPNAFAFRRYGEDFSDRNIYNRALELYDLSLDIDEHEIVTYLRIASVFRELKNQAKALETYNKALSILEINKGQLKKIDQKKMKDRIMRKLENMRNENN